MFLKYFFTISLFNIFDIASYVGAKSPISYTWRKSVNSSELQHGMNFAHGGTGVFNTLVDEPNMTTQVKFFQQLVEEKVYTKHDLNSSIALVSLAGNDYATYLIKNGDLQVIIYVGELIKTRVYLRWLMLGNLSVINWWILCMASLYFLLFI